MATGCLSQTSMTELFLVKKECFRYFYYLQSTLQIFQTSLTFEQMYLMTFCLNISTLCFILHPLDLLLNQSLDFLWISRMILNVKPKNINKEDKKT